jgi:small subunit ribosomal protein SAe
MLTREVLHMCGTIFCEHRWEVMPHLYFYRDPEEIGKKGQAATEKAVTREEFQGKWTVLAPEFTATVLEVADWSEVCSKCLLHLSRRSLLRLEHPNCH